MYCYEISDEMRQEIGLDYDLCACLQENPQAGFVVDDIAKVLAVFEGENEREDWRWVLRLKDNRYVFLQGGCDYTGWDCQSWATHKFCDSPEECAKCALGDVPIEQGKGPENAGLGHMLNILGGTYNEKFQMVYESLMKQLTDGKHMTWREKNDSIFRQDS